MRRHFSLLIALLALFTPFVSAEIYKTTDKQGRVVYTDQPASSDTKAKAVELRDTNTLPAIISAPYSPPTGTAAGAADITYNIDIISPTAGTLLLADQRNLSVSITLSQPLQADHKIAYFIDSDIALESSDLSVVINEPPRGEHKLHAAVKNKAGKVLGESPSVTFIVMRPIVK